MSKSFIDVLIIFLFMFFVFIVFGGKAKASDKYDTKTLADTIWQICENKTGDEKLYCFEDYTNCVINQGLPWKDEYIFNCMKDLDKRLSYK